MTFMPCTTKFAPAFLAAQQAMHHALFDASNPHFRSNYATLGAVIDAVKPHLNANGISILQMEVPSEPGTVAIETMLLHTSGESMSCISRIPLARADAHSVGSAYTYARRYGLSAICGIFSEADDDGNRAVHPTGRGTTSTFRTAYDEGGIENREQCAKVKEAIELHLEADDYPAAVESWDSIADDRNTANTVWHMLSKPQREALTIALGQDENYGSAT